MNRAELKNLIQGVVVTTPTPFDEDFKLDLARTTDITRQWIEDGLGTVGAPLKIAAAGGEGPDLTDDEWHQLLRTTVNAAGSGAVIMTAIQPRNTLQSIEDAKKAQDLGAIGLQVDLPFFHHPNQDDYVMYFTDLSDAIDIGIMIYNTFWFGCPPITAETIRRLNDAENVVAIKWNANRPGGDYYEMCEFADQLNVIDNGGQRLGMHKAGGRGFISSTATAYAPYELNVWKLLEERRYDEAEAEIDRVRPLLGAWRDRSKAKSGGYRHLKAFMTVSGRDVGDPRPPTLRLDEDELEDLRNVYRQVGWPIGG